MLSFQSLAPHAGVRRLQGPSRCQAPGVTRLTARARKQTEKQDVEADLADTTLPADLQKLSKLAKAELQQHLESRGLDKDGNKEELANRLLDNMIAQESALSTNPPDRVMLQQQLDQSTNTARRGRRTSRKATASADPQPELPSAAQASDPVVAAAAASAAVAEQVVDAPAASSRRGRKTSRKATSSTDPLPSPADIVAAAETAAKPSSTTGRGRKTSRKATSSADPLPSAAEAMMAAAGAAPAAAGSEETTDVKGTRRGRKTSRKATTSAEPTQDPVAAAAEAATAAAAVVEASSPAADVGSSTIRRARRSKSTAADPIPTAAEDATAAKAGRGRKTSRKSSVVEPVEASAVSAPTFDEPAAAPTTRQRGRASAKTASKAPTAAADQPAAASSPPLSRAKLLAQQLAQKEKATHGAGAAAAAAASAAASASAPAAAPGSSWVTSDELLYAGSQAQPDSLLLGADSTFSVDNGSVDEVMAQLTAERAAGLADEPALRPEAVLSPLTNSSSSSGVLQQPQEVTQPALADIAAAADAAPQQYMQSFVEATATDGTATADDGALSAFDHMMLPPSAGAADAAASAVVNTEQKQTEEDLQHPSMADCVAAVEEPLKASAEAVVLDEAPDAAMAAFDHDTSLDTPAAAAAADGNQVPSLLDIADLAAESAQEGSPLGPSLEESVGEDEEPDVALAAFDHMAVPEAAAAAPAAPAAPAAAFTNSSSSSKTEAAAASDGGYDQAYLDPLQPSATVGSGSVDLADAEAAAVVVPAPSAAAAKPAAAAASASAAVQPQQQPKGSSSAGAGSADLSVLVQRWWESVVQMFEDWQKNLSGPK